MQQIYGRKVCEKPGKTREKPKTRGEFTHQKKHQRKGKYIVFTDQKMQIGDKEWGKTWKNEELGHKFRRNMGKENHQKKWGVESVEFQKSGKSNLGDAIFPRSSWKTLGAREFTPSNAGDYICCNGCTRAKQWMSSDFRSFCLGPPICYGSPLETCNCIGDSYIQIQKGEGYTGPSCVYHCLSKSSPKENPPNEVGVIKNRIQHAEWTLLYCFYTFTNLKSEI